MLFNRILTCGMLLVFLLGSAQSTVTIQLLDYDDYSPISDAIFKYGEQQGASDINGQLIFKYTEGLNMVLSHVSYGEWFWNDSEIKRLIQEKVYYRRSSSIDLYPVTVIALRKTSQPETRLGIDYEERMEHDGAAILNQVASISSIRKSGNYGFDPVFRGFKYDQLNIVLNGAQSATAACPNRMDPPTSQMAPNMMDRVEVLKGPHALRYGTGFGGTINFIPSKLRFTAEQDLYGRVSSAYEGNGNILRGEGQLGYSTQSTDISFFGAWSQGDDYESGDDQTVQSDFLRRSFGLNAGFKLSADQQLRLSAMYNMARDADFPALPMDLRMDNTYMFNLRHDIDIDRNKLKSWNTTVYGSFVDHLMDNLLKPLEPRMINAETVAKTFNYGARTESVWEFQKDKLFMGADLRHEGAEGIRTREFLIGPNAGNVVEDNAWQNGRINRTGLFGEYQIKRESFDLVLSGRLEFNLASIEDPDSGFTEVYEDTRTEQFNPAISLGIIKEFDNSISMGLWAGRAQRSGSLTERYINFFPVGQDPFEMLGNPDLNPEINNQIDLNINWANEKTSLSADFFTSFLRDYISSVITPEFEPVIPMSPGVRQFINIDRVFKTGFEINWGQRILQRLEHQFALAYTYAQDQERDEPLPEIPPLDLRYRLSGSFLTDKLKPQLTYRFVAEQARISTEFGETRTPSFSLVDIGVRYDISEKISLSAAVNNLFNETYYEHLNRSVRGSNDPIFEPGRNISTQLSISF